MQRTVATRRSILEATRALLLAGVAEPVAREIAETAGITPRTLFRHFDDMDALYAALVRAAEEQAIAIMNEPFEAASGSWEAGLDLIIERRARVFESLLPLYASRIWGREAAVGGSAPRPAHARMRQRLLEVLPEEMRSDAPLFEAVNATLGLEFWFSLRQTQQLDLPAARAAVRCAVERLTGARLTRMRQATRGS
jgi:AcrR family transcriptional regulator